MNYQLTYRLIFGLLLSSLLLFSCGDDTETGGSRLAEGKFDADSHLPGTLSGIALQKMSVLKTELQVQNYMGGLAEVYFDYQLVGLAAAVYAADTITLSTEIAQFATPVAAYGFYSRTRSNNVELIDLGAEAYREGNSFYFTQANYAVTISASDSGVSDLMQRLAVTISADMKDRGGIPESFGLFPKKNQIRASYRYVAANFMNIARLDGVFSCSYASGKDTLTLFLSEDGDGDDFLVTREHMAGEFNPAPETIGFDEDYGIAFESVDFGGVIGGLAEGYFIGAYNYDATRHQQVITDWVGSFRSDE